MTVDAEFEIDKAYFSQSYAEWRSAISRYRRYQLWLGFGMAILGLLFCTYTIFPLAGYALFLFSAIEMAEYFWSRRKWISARQHERSALPKGSRMAMQFSPSGFDHNGPTTQGHVDWTGVKAVKVTRRGIFLKVADGFSIYVPKDALRPADGATWITDWHRRST